MTTLRQALAPFSVDVTAAAKGNGLLFFSLSEDGRRGAPVTFDTSNPTSNAGATEPTSRAEAAYAAGATD